MPDSENVQEISAVAGAAQCSSCLQQLCMRQQVINLALGQVDTMQCLTCFATQNDQTPADVMESIVPYILSRDCFAKRWRENAESNDCLPDCPCHAVLSDAND